MPNIDWTVPRGGSERDREFLSAIQDAHLVQHVAEPTRKAALLDLVLATDDDLAIDVKVRDNLGDSDHCVITWDIGRTKLDARPLKVSYNYKKANFDRLRECVGGVDWVGRLHGLTVEEQWEAFKALLQEFMEDCIPKKSKKSLNRPVWFTGKIKALISNKKRKWDSYRRTGNKADYEEYRAITKELKREIRSARREVEERLAREAKRNPKAFYRYASGKCQHSIGPLMNGGKLVAGNREMAGLLNEFFASVFTLETDSLPVLEEVTSARITDICITEEEIVSRIGKLKEGKATGPDGIPARVIKELAREISKPLKIIFENSFSRGEVPRDWKLANVVPIFKKGEKSNPSNYRPVSLTSIPGKIMESILRDHILDFLEGNALIRDSQHGFRRRRNCLTNLLEFYDWVTKQRDEGNPVDIVYLDFAKAFDTVPHRRLRVKLEAHGIQGRTCEWVSNWLSGREQRVMVNGEVSTAVEVVSGVPQGSVLGPLLFLVYINDLDEGLEGKISKFADDTKIGFTIKGEADRARAERDLGLLDEWSKKWLMRFNKSKCKVLHIGRNNGRSLNVFGVDKLEEANGEKDLGITIDEEMKFSSHAQATVAKCNRVLGYIRRSIASKSSHVILPLYAALVRPLLEYGIQFWRPGNKGELAALEGVQRRATRMIKEVRGLSYEKRLEVLGLFSLERRLMRGDLIQAFKIIKGIDNVDRERFFQFDSSNKTRGNNLKLQKPAVRLRLRQNYFTCRVVNAWNALGSDVVAAPSVTSFKKKLDVFMSKNTGR